MTIKNDKINIYEVNSLIFQMISFMSEDERRKLQTVLTAKLSDERNEKDLSSLITGMSEAKRCELLERLTNWYNSKISKLMRGSRPSELRRYARKLFKIPVELSKNGFTFLCCTQNISKSGAFIQTDFDFHIDQKVNINFSPLKIEKGLSIGGKIIRVDSSGIGVKFDTLIPDFWHTPYRI
jgi:hypothetical protein